MAKFYEGLFLRAREAATDVQQRIEGLQNEILNLEQSVTEKKAALKLAMSAVHRLDHFRPEVGGDVQCPDCWVTRGVQASIVPIPSSTGDDLFRCNTCHQEFSIKF